MTDVIYWIHGLEVCRPCKDHLLSRTVYDTYIGASLYHWRGELACDWCGAPMNVLKLPEMEKLATYE